MKFWKKSLIAATCLTLAFGAVACGGNGGNSSLSSSSSSSSSGNQLTPEQIAQQQQAAKLSYVEAISQTLENAKSFKIDLDMDIEATQTPATPASGATATPKIVASIDGDMQFTEKTVGEATSYEFMFSYSASYSEQGETGEPVEQSISGAVYLVNDYIYEVLGSGETTVYQKTTESVTDIITYMMGEELSKEIVDAYVGQLSALIGETGLTEAFVKTEIAKTANIKDGILVVGFDAKDALNDMFAYLGEDPKISKVLNDVLAEIDEDLTVASICDVLETSGSKTVGQLVAGVDAWLTEEYETTLQGIYDKLLANAEVVKTIKMVTGCDDAAIAQYKQLQISTLWADYSEITVDQLLAMATYDDNGTPEDTSDDTPAMTIAQVVAMVEPMLEQNIGAGGAAFCAKNTTVNAFNASIGGKYGANNTIESIVYEFNVDIDTIIATGEDNGQGGATFVKAADISVDASASCKIYELSGNEATITLPSGVTWNEVSVLE